MEPKPIDLTTLAKALAQLREAIDFWQSCEPRHPLKPHLRAAVIQSFEFSYELTIRVVKRVILERAVSTETVNDLSFSNLLRLALDAGLPMTLDTWRRWRDLRNATSHAYDEARAIEVAVATPEFLSDAENILVSLQSATKLI